MDVWLRKSPCVVHTANRGKASDCIKCGKWCRRYYFKPIRTQNAAAASRRRGTAGYYTDGRFYGPLKPGS